MVESKNAQVTRYLGVGSVQNGCLLTMDEKGEFDPDDDWVNLKEIKFCQPSYTECQFDLSSIQTIHCGPKHCIGVSNDKTAWLWGEHFATEGQNKELNLMPVKVLNGKDIQLVSCGFDHTLVSTIDDKLYTWGRNSQGQVGLPPKDQKIVRYPAQLQSDVRILCMATSARSSLILQTEGELVAFGYNRDCQLGFGPGQKSIATPQIVPQVPYSKIQIRQISCGLKHSVFLTECKQLFGCGSNKRGQLGPLEKDQIDFYSQIPIDFLDSEDVGKLHVQCSWNNTVIHCTKSDKLWITGCNKYGQLATGSKEPDSRRDFEQIKVSGTIRSLHCMSESYVIHVQYLYQDSNRQALYSWGWNEHGNLGLGDKQDRAELTKIPGLEGLVIKDVFAGGAYFFIKI